MKGTGFSLRLLHGLFAMLTLLVLSANLQKAHAADLELVCPCAIDSNGPTSMAIRAGVRNNDSAGTSGSFRFRVIAHDTPSFYDSSFNSVGNIELLSTLSGGTELPIATYKTGYDAPYAEIRHYTLWLEEDTGSGWARVDSIRMQQRARSVKGAGTVSGSGHVFFDGRVTSRVEGGEIFLDLPTIRNISSSVDSGDLEVRVWQENAAGNSYYDRAVISLGISLASRTELSPQTVSSVYSEVGAAGYDYFDVVLLGGGYILASQRLYITNGNAEQRFFSMESIDVLSDDDDDTVSNYNEHLKGTDAGDPAEKPGKAVVRVMVYYSDELPPLYSGDPLPRIEHLMDVSNQVLTDSGADVTLELAKTEQITLPANVTNSQVLDDMENEEAPFTNLLNTRKTELVDIVLVMQPYRNDGNCGIATLGGSQDDGDLASLNNAENANGVVSINGSCRDSSTIHEIGHILGLGHSRAQGSIGTFEWSLGHGESGQFVTIMPYASFFGSAPEIALFSTPSLDCLPGKPCGVIRSDPVNGAEAVLSINTVSHQVAAYTQDSDSDGTANALDNDDDEDGTPDTADEVPLDPNDITDTDLDGIGNYRDVDDDGDGLSDTEEGSRGTNPLLWDTDNDGFKDDLDAFPVNEAASTDADEDGLPDAWNFGCNTACQSTSGLTLDDDPAVAACPDYVCRPSFTWGWRAVLLKPSKDP